jgi:hypothetical protein
MEQPVVSIPPHLLDKKPRYAGKGTGAGSSTDSAIDRLYNDARNRPRERHGSSVCSNVQGGSIATGLSELSLRTAPVAPVFDRLYRNERRRQIHTPKTPSLQRRLNYQPPSNVTPKRTGTRRSPRSQPDSDSVFERLHRKEPRMKESPPKNSAPPRSQSQEAPMKPQSVTESEPLNINVSALMIQRAWRTFGKRRKLYFSEQIVAPYDEKAHWRSKFQQPEPVEPSIDSRKHRIQAGLGDGEVWGKLDDYQGSNRSIVNMMGECDWVIENALAVLADSEEGLQDALPAPLPSSS